MIDIILSAYNGEKYIEEQIESILDSEYEDFRLFVFDDVSNDATVQIVSRYEEKYPGKVRLIRNFYNKGFCRNFLEGLKYAVKNSPAEYYVFCDQDDIWLENRLTVCRKRMKELEDIYSKETPLLEFTDAVMVDANMDSLGTTFFKADRLNTGKLDLPRILIENKCIGCTSFMNSALAEKIAGCEGGFDARIRYHDWWSAITAAAFGKIEYIDVPTVLYRQHGGNEVGQKSFSGYVSDRMGRITEDKARLKKTIAQASAFYKAYARELKPENKRILREFIALGWADPLERRCLIIKNGFYKSGLIRNVGMFIMI